MKDGATGMIFKIGDKLSFAVKPNAISGKLGEPGALAGAVKLRGLLYKKPAGKKRKALDISQLEILEILN